MNKAFARKSMMGCSIKTTTGIKEDKTEKGLILGHTYSITKVSLVEIVTPNRSGLIPLIRLRNPWGNEDEWQGSFSDRSKEWKCIPDEAKAKIDLTFDNDGEFWMSFGDFQTQFDYLEICNLSPDCFPGNQENGTKAKWNTNILEGKWKNGLCAGDCSNYSETFHTNPQFVMTIEDSDKNDDISSCTVVVSLMQKNSRLKRNMGIDFLSIGFVIYAISKEEMQQKPQGSEFFENKIAFAKTKKFQNFREINERFQLPSGSYLIVPSTFYPNTEGEFVIRIFSEGFNTFIENDESVGLNKVS